MINLKNDQSLKTNYIIPILKWLGLIKDLKLYLLGYGSLGVISMSLEPIIKNMLKCLLNEI